MADEIERLVVEFAMDSSGFQHGVSGINRQLKLVQSEFKEAAAKLGNFGNAEKKLELKSESLTKQIKIQQDKVEALRKSLKESVDTKGNDARATQNLAIKTNRAKEALAKMEDQLEQTNREIKDERSVLKKLDRQLEESGRKMQELGDRFSQAGQGLTLGLTVPIAGAAVTATKAAIDFETAFTGVKKTVNATKEEYAELAKGIRDMAKRLPASAEEIAGVAEAAGQLGIKKDSILEFTETMIALGVSTNLSSDQAATALARLANITQLPQDEFDNLGSTIVALGNNLATTEAEITEMGLRIAAAGNQIGLTEPQILAFAGALSSVGVKAEAGGSAISRVMVDIASAVAKGGEKLETFAEVSGQSAGEFSKAFEKNAAGAILGFIEGLGDMQEEGKNTFAVLDDLDLNTIRVRDALLRAAGAGDAFREALELGSDAWKENTALTKEAQKRYETTASQLKILWNQIKDVGITLGQALIPALMDAVDAMDPLIDFLGDMAEGFADLDESTQRIILAFAGIAAALGPILLVLGPIISGFGSLALAFSTAGLSMTALLGPVGLVAAGVAGLTIGTIAVVNSTHDLKDVSLETADAMQKRHDKQAKMIDQLAALRQKSSLTNDEFARYLDLQTRLKSATDPEAIKVIKEAMEKLQKKSGLSNKELEQMVGLNKKITETMPKATDKITEQGNRIAGTTNELRKYNDQLQKATVRELQVQRLKAIQNQKKLQEKINNLESEYKKSLQAEKELRNQLLNYSEAETQEKIEQIQKDIKAHAGQKVYIAGQKIKIENLRKGKSLLREQLINMIKNNDETKKQLQQLKTQKSKLDLIDQRLKSIYLQNAGISQVKADQNAKDGTAIDLIRTQITKLKEKKQKMLEQTPVQQRHNALFRRGIDEIEGQIGKLRTARSNILQNTGAAKDLNIVLGEDITKNITFTGDGLSEARRISNELDRNIWKNVTVDFDYSDAGYYMGHVRAFQNAYAEGTDNYPGGIGLVGEEGPELVKLPQGSQIIPNDRTEQILSGMTQLATGGEILRDGWAMVGERGRELYAPPARSAEASQSYQEPEVRVVYPSNMTLRIGQHEFIAEVVDDITEAQETRKNRQDRAEGLI